MFTYTIMFNYIVWPGHKNNNTAISGHLSLAANLAISRDWLL